MARGVCTQVGFPGTPERFSGSRPRIAASLRPGDRGRDGYGLSRAQPLAQAQAPANLPPQTFLASVFSGQQQFASGPSEDVSWEKANYCLIFSKLFAH